MLIFCSELLTLWSDIHSETVRLRGTRRSSGMHLWAAAEELSFRLQGVNEWDMLGLFTLRRNDWSPHHLSPLDGKAKDLLKLTSERFMPSQICILYQRTNRPLVGKLVLHMETAACSSERMSFTMNLDASLCSQGSWSNPDWHVWIRDIFCLNHWKRNLRPKNPLRLPSSGKKTQKF